VSRENALHLVYSKGSERQTAARGCLQWIFPILIVAGMILIGVAVLLLLLQETAPAHALEACVWAGKF
jgi:hypothetical protein